MSPLRFHNWKTQKTQTFDIERVKCMLRCMYCIFSNLNMVHFLEQFSNSQGLSAKFPHPLDLDWSAHFKQNFSYRTIMIDTLQCKKAKFNILIPFLASRKDIFYHYLKSIRLASFSLLLGGGYLLRYYIGLKLALTWCTFAIKP